MSSIHPIGIALEYLGIVAVAITGIWLLIKLKLSQL